MFNQEVLSIEGKEVLKVVINDIVALQELVKRYQNIKNNVDEQGMDIGNNRDNLEINLNVNMGIIGHIIINKILENNQVLSSPIFETDGFRLKIDNNSKTVKVRTSLGKYPPCPARQVRKFTISGYDVSQQNIYDYYIQVIFCGEFNILKEESPITLYIIGGLHSSELNSEQTYTKQTIKVGDIRSSKSLNSIIPKLK